MVRLLCSRGADINCPMKPSRSLQVLLGAHAGATPLHLAADQGNVSVCVRVSGYGFNTVVCVCVSLWLPPCTWQLTSATFWCVRGFRCGLNSVVCVSLWLPPWGLPLAPGSCLRQRFSACARFWVWVEHCIVCVLVAIPLHLAADQCNFLVCVCGVRCGLNSVVCVCVLVATPLGLAPCTWQLTKATFLCVCAFLGLG